MNRQACESLGYTRQELLAMRLQDIVATVRGHDNGAITGSDMPGREHVTLVRDHRKKMERCFRLRSAPGIWNWAARR